MSHEAEQRERGCGGRAHGEKGECEREEEKKRDVEGDKKREGLAG